MEIYGQEEGDKKEMTIEKTLTADPDQPVRIMDKGIVYIGPQRWVYQQIWETNEPEAVEDNKIVYFGPHFGN